MFFTSQTEDVFASFLTYAVAFCYSIDSCNRKILKDDVDDDDDDEMDYEGKPRQQPPKARSKRSFQSAESNQKEKCLFVDATTRW